MKGGASLHVQCNDEVRELMIQVGCEQIERFISERTRNGPANSRWAEISRLVTKTYQQK